MKVIYSTFASIAENYMLNYLGFLKPKADPSPSSSIQYFGLKADC